MDYNYLTPLAILGITFIGTSMLCELIHRWNPEWYANKMILYPTLDKKEKQRQHLFLELLPIVIRNLVFSAILLPTIWHFRLRYSSSSFSITNLNAHPVFSILDLFLLEKISQIWFFHAHYAVHRSPFLYRIVHKMHHQHHEPSVFTAIHCTIWEMLLLNLPAVALGPLLVLPNIYIHCLWYVLAGLYTPIVHSGYQLCSFFDPKYHDEHHRKLYCNFGSRMLDKLYKTHLESSDLNN